MCRMIAVMSREEIDYKYIIEDRDNGGAFHSLKAQSEKAYDAPHKDGFGIYSMTYGKSGETKTPNYELFYKKGIPISESKELPVKLDNLKGNLLISHIRLATKKKGEIDDIHAHPYVDANSLSKSRIKDITDWDNNEKPFASFVMAHNGTIHNIGNESMTDSQAFLNLITERFSGGIDFGSFKKFLYEFSENHEFTAINLLLKDPCDDLYAVRLAKARLAYYSMYYMKDDIKGLAIVASEPIDSDRRWKCINNYSLIKITKNLDMRIEEIS